MISTQFYIFQNDIFSFFLSQEINKQIYNIKIEMLSELSDLIKEYPQISFCVMLIIFSIIGYLIVTRYLMEKQIRNCLPKTIFIITFVCSLSLLAMYLYQISMINLPQSLWDLTLSSLVIICTIVIPIALLLKLPYATKQITIIGTQSKIPILAICLIILYLRLLSLWSSEIKSQKKIYDQIDIFTKQHINILVQILVNYGVVIMAMMSAYGAIWCPYIYFNHTETKRDDLLAAKKKIKAQIFFIIEQIKKNKYSIIKLKDQQAKINKQLLEQKNLTENTSLLVRSFKAVIGRNQGDYKKDLLTVQQKIDFHNKEIDTLHRVHHESFSIYRQIVDQQRKHLISDTIMGKIFRLFSLILAVYSVSRFILTAWNMIKGRKLSTDPITRFLNFVVWLLDQNINDTFRLYTQYISFGFMGYLMISSVRSFSINIKNFFDFVLRRRRLNILSTDTLVLLLSQMYGIYFLSAVILLQSSLPRTYVTNFEHLTGEVRLVEHFTKFDFLFFWGCILSLLFIAICEMQRKQKMNVIKERNFVEMNF